MKKKLLILLSLAICFLMGISYAVWIIKSEKAVSPTYDPLAYIKYELDNKTVQYNGSAQFPSTSNLSGVENDTELTISYTYKGFNDLSFEPYTTGLPKNAGEYKITIEFDNKSTTLDFTINRLNYDLSGITMSNATYDYDGTPKSILISGSLPTGLSVAYKYNGVSAGSATNAGVYTVTAEFNGDSTNYEPVASMSATLTINKIVDPSYVALTSLDAYAGQRLSDIDLPAHFSWYEDDTTPVGSEGTHTFHVNYTPTDTVNYISYTNLPVDVIVTGASTNQLVIVATNNISTPYNGQNQYPTASVVDSNNVTVDSSKYTLTYYYKLTSASTYTEGYPKNAGTYNIKITCASSSLSYLDADDLVITYTISKKEISFDDVVSLNYNASIRTWDQIKSAIQSNIELDGVCDGDTVTLTVNGMHNGKYKYGTVSGSYTAPTSDTIFGSSYTNVIGSTYQVFVSLTSDNYTLASNSFILKYKTALISSTYYTIEDAFAASGTISFAGDSSGGSTYVATTFTSLPTSATGYASNTTFSLNGRTLIVPYTNSTTQYANVVGTTSGNVYSALIVPSTITINLTNSATIAAAAQFGAIGGGKCTISTLKGVLVNSGTINAASGCNVNAYGFIKGLGTINLANGSNAIDCLCSYDWPGGTAASGMYSKVFITNSYTLHNNSCPTNINAGAKYSGYLMANISSGARTGTAVLIAASGTSNCLFKPAGSTGNIYKTTTNPSALLNITSSNQTVNYNDVFEITGDYQDGTISVSVYVTLSTSKSKSTPIGHQNIVVKSGSSLTISAADYLFLPGTSLTIEEGASVTTSGTDVDVVFATYDEIATKGTGGSRLFTSNSYSTDHNDAYLLCNGTFTCGGGFAGKITTTSENATVKLNSKTTGSYVCMYSASSPYYFSNTSPTKMYIYGLSGVSANPSEVSTGTYYSIKDSNNNYGFYTTSGTISYNLNGGTGSAPTKNITIGSSGYTITASDVPSTDPTRAHYTFDGWYLDSGYTTPAIGLTIYCGVELIAKWNVNNYNINYHDVYNNNFTTGDTSVTTNPTTFTYETNTSLSDPTNGDYVFAGWYLDNACTNKVAVLTGSSLVSYLSGNDVSIYALWFPAGTAKYSIDYVNTNSNVVCMTSDTLVVDESYNWSNYALPVMTGKDNDPNVTLYFGGWLDNESVVTSINDSMFTYNLETNTYELTLTASWVNKNDLSVVFDNTVIKHVFYKPGYSFTVPSTSSYGLVMPAWNILLNWNLDGVTFNVGDRVTLDTQTTLTANIVKFVKVTIGSNSYTNITVTLTSRQGYLVNSDANGNGTSYEAFNGSTKGNGTTFYVTQGSVFAAKYAANGGQSNGGSITDTTSTTALTTSNQNYTVGTSNVTITPSGSAASCVIEGTMITLADGTRVPVEDLKGDEMLLVWNLITGTYDIAPIVFIDVDDAMSYNVITLFFSNGTTVGVVTEHGFFDIEEARYVYIDEYNCLDYIGHHFMSEDGTIVTLDNAIIDEQIIRTYSPVTFAHLNYYVNGMLSMPGGISGIFNIFDVDTESMKYDEVQMALDLETYGALTFEDYQDMITLDMYYAFNGEWLNVAIGKGLITWEDIAYLAGRYGPLCE